MDSINCSVRFAENHIESGAIGQRGNMRTPRSRLFWIPNATQSNNLERCLSRCQILREWHTGAQCTCTRAWAPHWARSCVYGLVFQSPSRLSAAMIVAAVFAVFSVWFQPRACSIIKTTILTNCFPFDFRCSRSHLFSSSQILVHHVSREHHPPRQHHGPTTWQRAESLHLGRQKEEAGAPLSVAQ